MWHFMSILRRWDHCCCGSLVLEVIPDLRSIGVWRRNLPFSGSKQQNLRTFFGGHCRGLVDPKAPKNIHMSLISSYNGDMKVFTEKDLPNRSRIAKVAKLAILAKVAKGTNVLVSKLAYDVTNTHLTIYITRSF